MNSNFFKTLGAELDKAVDTFKEGLDTLSKDLESELDKVKKESKKENTEKEMEDLINDFGRAVFGDDFETMQKPKSKTRQYKIKIKNFDSTKLGFDMEKREIQIGSKNTEKTFNIPIKKSVDFMTITEILQNVDYNEDTEILSIFINKKYIRRD